ncbi:MAG: ABC transporter permease [Halobacteriales archaeon]
MAGLLAGILDATVRAGTPLLLAALGELISERGGVLNLGVEGMMLAGAFVGFVTAFLTGSAWLGFAAGIAAGAALSAIHAVLCITLKADQVISGVTLTLLGAGVTTFFGQSSVLLPDRYTSWVSAPVEGFSAVTVPVVGGALAGLPLVGPALFRNTLLEYVAVATVPVVSYLLFRTNLGLELVAVGDDPEAADTMGVPVFELRYLAVLVGGGFAGAAGAYFSLAFPKGWNTGMTAGIGWIAVALVIFAQWQPWRALAGAYLFGGIDALVLRSQAISFAIPADAPLAGVLNPVVGLLTNPQFMATYPYLATLLVLVAATGRSLTEQAGAPSALLENYSRELD